MNTKNKILLFGSLIGAVTGLIAAMLLNRRVQEDTTEIVISPGEGMKVGVLVFGLLRAISSLGDDN